jgi:hypothetical protein
MATKLKIEKRRDEIKKKIFSETTVNKNHLQKLEAPRSL